MILLAYLNLTLWSIRVNLVNLCVSISTHMFRAELNRKSKRNTTETPEDTQR